MSAQKRKPIVLDDSDQEDGKKVNGSSTESKSGSAKKDSKAKKRRVIYSSDEDEPKPLKETNSTVSSKVAKLKAVNVSNAFGSAPIKRVEKEKKPKKLIEQDVFDADTDDMELMKVDEEILSPKSKKRDSSKKDIKVKVERQTSEEEKAETKKNHKTPEEVKMEKIKSEKKSPEKVKTEKKTPIKEEKQSPNDSKDKNSKTNGESSSKRQKKDTPPSKKKPKKQIDEADLDRSVYDPDQEKHEKRRATAQLYHQFQKRAGPSNPGSKEIPKGKKDCLAGLAFVLTGVYESMERDEAIAVIKDFGGRVTSALSGKTNYMVAGEESGPAKLQKAEDLGVTILSEDDLFDLIREKSGLPTLKQKSKVKEEVKSPIKQQKKSEKRTHSPAKHDTPTKVKVEDKKNIKADGKMISHTFN